MYSRAVAQRVPNMSGCPSLRASGRTLLFGIIWRRHKGHLAVPHRYFRSPSWRRQVIPITCPQFSFRGLLVLLLNLPSLRQDFDSSRDTLDKKLSGQNWSQRMPRSAIRQRRFSPCVFKNQRRRVIQKITFSPVIWSSMENVYQTIFLELFVERR